MVNFFKLFSGTRKNAFKVSVFDGEVIKKKMKGIRRLDIQYFEDFDILLVTFIGKNKLPFFYDLNREVATIRKIDSTTLVIENGSESVHVMLPSERLCDDTFIGIRYWLRPHQAAFEFENDQDFGVPESCYKIIAADAFADGIHYWVRFVKKVKVSC